MNDKMINWLKAPLGTAPAGNRRLCPIMITHGMVSLNA